MSRIPNDGLSIYPRKAAPAKSEKETPAEDKPKRTRRRRQTENDEE